MIMMACTVSMDLTEAAIDHFRLDSAIDSRAGYKIRSRGLVETAQPNAQMAEKSMKDDA